MGCQLCSGAYGFNPGLLGKNASQTGIMFILHRPDERAVSTLGEESYETALRDARTGKTLSGMLGYCGLTWNDIFLTNLFKCVLLNDRQPSKEEYERCLELELNR